MSSQNHRDLSIQNKQLLEVLEISQNTQENTCARAQQAVFFANFFWPKNIALKEKLKTISN